MVTPPGRASDSPLDITQEQGLDDVAFEPGKVNGLVCQQEAGCPASTDHWNEAGVGRMTSANLTGTDNARGIAFPVFAGRGHIVLRDSLAGIFGMSGLLRGLFCACFTFFPAGSPGPPLHG